MAGRGTHCARWQMHPRARRWAVAWRSQTREISDNTSQKTEAVTLAIAGHALLRCAARHSSPEGLHITPSMINTPSINTPTAELGKQTLFITNNSSMHSDDYKDRFQRCVSPLGCLFLFFFPARFKSPTPVPLFSPSDLTFPTSARTSSRRRGHPPSIYSSFSFA